MEIDDWEGRRSYASSAPAPGSHRLGGGGRRGVRGAVDGREAVAFTASYDLSFASVLLAGYLDKHHLVVDAYSIFTDSSGRAAYFQRDNFYLP